MDATPEEVDAGHAFYTKRSLAVYDALILGFFSRVAWKCSARRILEHYDEHVTGNHLDIGVGTGYFLDKCRYPTSRPRVALMDLNRDCLDAAARRVARFNPERYEANVLEPIALDIAPFDSIGMNYLLHCVPGTLRAKASVFDHVAAVANPGARVFGATLLHDGVERNFVARKVMDRNNAHGIFHNAHDDLAGLRTVVSERLRDGRVDVVGCVGLFSGTL